MILRFFLLIGLLTSLSLSAIDVRLSSQAAILVNSDNGAVLFEKNSDEEHYPASITKVATALYAMEMSDMSSQELVEGVQDAIGAISTAAKKKYNYTKPAYWLEFGSSHIGIKKGERLPVEALFYGMMLSSGNDAANMIAYYVSGSVPRFMDELNAYIKELGCSGTTFYNPHGLFYPGHVTTARDMSIIARKAIEKEYFREVVGAKRYKRPQTNLQKPSWMLNFNKLLFKGEHYYPYAIGIKTGYCFNAQNTLVAAAEKDGRTLVAVLLYCDERDNLFRDARILFEAAFKESAVEKTLFSKGVKDYIVEIDKAKNDLRVYLENDLTVKYFPSEKASFKAVIHWNELVLPIKQGSEVGFIQIVDEKNAKIVRTEPLLAYNDVNKSCWSSIRAFFSI